MHLKSLTLRGFKSFAQPTTFQFEPGVTAIVGPNGSGKSNVVDALAWVMGEQGAKTLRGGKMEDVIFAGTSTRGPLGRAEVRLTIDNSDGALPIEYTEVTISRILFRNGSSEYAINGEGCRLLDVQELLSDSGLGREMHVIVGQGQLDTVLRATPEDRRGFIEEAAGILKHRRRKERTVRKLEAMETNLTRLNDLAGEIRRQLTPLGRQAEVARQAQRIAAEVRDAKARLIADDVSRLRTELAELSRSDAEQQRERAWLEELADAQRARITELEREQQGEDLDTARRVTIGLESTQAKLRGLSAQTQQRLAFLATQAEMPDQVPLTPQHAVTDAREEAARLAELVPALADAWREAEQLTRSVQGSLDAVDEQIQAQSELVSRHDLELSALRGSNETATQKRLTVEQELTRRQQALTQARERAAEAESALAAFEEAAEQAELPEGGLDAAYTAAQEREAEATRAGDTLRESLHALEQESAGLDARVTALARSLDPRDASGAVLQSNIPGVSGSVADHVRVAEGYEAAVGTALGEYADALLVETAAVAESAVTQAHHEDLGRLRTVFAEFASVPAPLEYTALAAPASPSVPGLIRMDDVVLAAPAGVRGLLLRTYIAPDLSSALAGAAELRQMLSGGPFTVVTEAGDVLTEHTLSGGSALSPSSIEVAAELAEAQARSAAVARDIEAAEQSLAAQRELITNLQAASKQAYAELREADAQLAEHARTRQQLIVRAETLRSEADRAAKALTEVEAAAVDATTLEARAAEALRNAESQPRPIFDGGAREAVLAELEEARAAEMETRLSFETAKERVRAAEERSAGIAAQFEAERAAAAEAARRAVLRARQVARAESVAQALPVVQDACDRALVEARSEQMQAEQERARNNQELTQLRGQETEARAKLQQLTEQVHGAELRSYERKLQLSALLERASTELGLVEHVLVAEYGPEVGVPVLGNAALKTVAPADTAAARPEVSRQPETPLTLEEQLAAELGVTLEDAGEGGADRGTNTRNAAAGSTAFSATNSVGVADAGETETVPYVRAEQERRLKRAERKLSELGRINPLALEEFAALEQRHTFLVEQLGDLTRTRADLRQIIEDLDEKMEGIFGAAFEDTRAAFAEVFPILFPGGTGEISLSNPEDLLTTGIDITVRPAGKKVERLSLLSGGERSLAAVALLVAIFQARPSPFYIMDEVEAALDDANLGRLLEVFERLRASSQLIVITHQKRTMEIADALYGVSMRRDGISAVVGQRLGDGTA